MVIEQKESIWLDVEWETAPNGGVNITEIIYKGVDVFYIYYENNLLTLVEDQVIENLENKNAEGDYSRYLDWLSVQSRNQKKATETIDMVKLAGSLLMPKC